MAEAGIDALKLIKSLLVFSPRLDELVKSRKIPFFVIPAKTGSLFFQLVTELLDSGFHRSDDFLRNHQDLGNNSFSLNNA